VQIVGLAMWGLLFACLQNGLGKSFTVLDDVEVSKVQRVSRYRLSQIIKVLLTLLIDLLRKPYHTLHRTRFVEVLYPYSRSGSFQATHQGTIPGERHDGCCGSMGSNWHPGEFNQLLTSYCPAKTR
jgi:hypothetical protein